MTLHRKIRERINDIKSTMPESTHTDLDNIGIALESWARMVNKNYQLDSIQAIVDSIETLVTACDYIAISLVVGDGLLTMSFDNTQDDNILDKQGEDFGNNQ